MPHIEIKNLSKSYGKVKAIDNVNLEIFDKEYLTLLGPSGCGKTTILRAIAGLVQPDRGEILFDGKDITNLPPDERDIGMVFQHFMIFPFLDVWDNVTYPLKIKGKSDAEMEETAGKALNLVGLSRHVNEMPEDLSAPEMQKVGLARAFSTGSKLLLLDEPLSALDTKFRMDFQHELRKLVKGLGLTAIHVTHDQSVAMNIADRIAIMRKGRILQVATPMDLYYQPNSIFVCNFLSNSNFIEGFVEKQEEKQSVVRLRGFGPKIAIPTDKWERRKRLVLAIRRNEISFGYEASSKTNILNGKIVNELFLGDKTIFHLRLENEDIIEAEVLTKDIPMSMGHEVTLTFNIEDVMTFEYPDNLEDELALE
jgi:putrescine transport system ATP-binding protein